MRLSSSPFLRRSVLAACFGVLALSIPALADNMTAGGGGYYPDSPTRSPYGGVSPYDSPTVRDLGTLHEPANPEAMAPAFPPPAPALLQPAEVNGVTYVTGGIGDEERSALDALRPDYNLHVTSSSADGAFLGDAHIVIIHGSHELIDVPAGPIFLAQLAPGRYTVEARSAGQVKKQTVKIGAHGPATLHFVWQ